MSAAYALSLSANGEGGPEQGMRTSLKTLATPPQRESPALWLLATLSQIAASSSISRL
jgi:hypothetical protein